ncbi:MAG: pseudouridine synthase [Christensenellales bacterium]
MRLNKYIALCGAASRRRADKLIINGKVSVNGKITKTLGISIDIEKDMVCLNGITLIPTEKKLYIMLNKPAGYICACSDDRGRRTVIDLINIDQRIYPVGRLDYDTEGLLILTNDGDFAYQVMHPKHEIEKKYYAVVKGVLNYQSIKTLCDGVIIEGARTSKAKIELIQQSNKNTEVYVTIHEGKNRQIKKMFEKVGCKVTYLKRISIGNLELGDMAIGEWRMFSVNDISLFR